MKKIKIYTPIMMIKKISMTIDSNEMWVNGECITLDVAPFIIKDRTFVPIRAISEALNYIVEWDGANTSVIIIGGTNSIKPTSKPTKQSATPQPTNVPTAKPTSSPTSIPTLKPTDVPTTAPTLPPTAQPNQNPSTESEMEKDVFTLVNKVRVQNGLSSLSWADDIANIARNHSSDMINRNFFSHTNPDGQSPFDRLKNNGISYRTAAENIAYGQKTAEAVMNGWMNSSGHRANILNANVKEIGVGAVKSSNGAVYWTQVFVSR